MAKVLISRNSEARIYKRVDADGTESIVKESANAFLLQSEAMMLEYLRPYIRVPKVFSCDNGVLVMEFIPNDPALPLRCEKEIAERLAHLHEQSSPTFGFECDTTIGPFRQINPQYTRWIDFYREARVLDFAGKALDEGRIDAALHCRIERFAADFETFLREPERPALLHGDIWGGNVLTQNGHFAAVIDPALYYGHYEMELAFIGMFHTFSDAFYRRYDELRPIAADFFELRAPIYRIFPYLVHIRAFGSGYISGLESILRRYGY